MSTLFAGSCVAMKTLKHPRESELVATYNFQRSKLLREHYISSRGTIRESKILEDSDGLAGAVASQHCYSNHQQPRKNPIFTYSADSIRFLRPLAGDEDLELGATIAWAGRASLKVRLYGRQLRQEVISGWLTFVPVNPKSKRPVPVETGVEPETEEEKARFSLAAAASMERYTIHQEEGNNNARVNLLHNAFICEPESENHQGRVYGGFIMGRAYDHAFATAYLYGGVPSWPGYSSELKHGLFLKAVHVGEMVELKSHIVQTDDTSCVVQVEISVATQRRGVFQFCFGKLEPGQEFKEAQPVQRDNVLCVWDSSLATLLKSRH